MLGIMLFFIVAYFVGRAIIALLELELGDLVFLASLVLGIIVCCLVLFFLGFIFPFGKWSIALCLAILLVGSLTVLWSKSFDKAQDRWEIGVREIIREIGDVVKKNVSLPWKVKFAGLGFILLVVWLFGRALFINEAGDIVAGDRLVWTDWPVHVGIAANFAWGQNFPPQNPFFAGISLIYPFFSDFLSGIFLALGATYKSAFTIPGIVLTLAFFGLFIKFAGRTKIKAMLALFISLFWGGLGFVYWFQEVLADEALLVERLISPPREYTFWSEKGMWFFTFLYSEILPQRAFLFGLPMFFLVLLLVKMGWDKPFGRAQDKWDKSLPPGKQGGEKHIFIAGAIAGIMPFFHTHSVLALGILSITLAATGGVGLIKGSKTYTKKYLKTILLFFLPFGFLGLVQLPLFLSKQNSFAFHFGWMKESDNFFWFWFKNTGFFWPLLILGLYKGKFSRFTKILGVASWSLFLLPNFFSFAPWGYDNLKIFTYWYLINSVFVVAGLVWIKQIKLVGPAFAGLLFLTLTLSGLVEVGRLIPTGSRQIGLWSANDQVMAKELRASTDPKALFLTAAIHDHPVSALAGRRIVIGYPGNMWSWGIPGWSQQEQDVRIMFQGGQDAQQLWKKYQVDYIIISDRERYFEPKLDEEHIEQNSTLILDKNNTKVYKVE